MNPKVKKLWLAALRSGKYQQGKEQLKTEEGKYCCLGVLQHLALEKDIESFNGSWSWGSPMTSQVVHEWAEIDVDDEEDLAALNDSGATFEQIALCIENGL